MNFFCLFLYRKCIMALSKTLYHDASSFWWDVKPLVNVLCNALCTHSALTEREGFAPVLLVGLAKFIKLLDLHLVICSIFRPSLIKQPGLHEFSLPLYCCFQCFVFIYLWLKVYNKTNLFYGCEKLKCSNFAILFVLQSGFEISSNIYLSSNK